MDKLRTILIYSALLLAGLTLPIDSALSEPNYYERELIKNEVRKDLEGLINMWREELYFEMYEWGTQESRSIISLQQFTKRMIELNYYPVESLNALQTSVAVYFRTIASIETVIDYVSKIDSSNKFNKRQYFLIIKEKDRWRINLLDLVGAPYS